MKINKKKLGFTLVELLVVIAILAVLATVAIIGYSSFINEAHKSNDNSVVTELNHYLKAANPLDEEVPTATDAAEKLEGCGLNIAELQPSAKDAYYGYNYKSSEFVYIEDILNWQEDGQSVNAERKLSTFVFAKKEGQVSAAYTNGYSVYLQKDYNCGTGNYANTDFKAVNGLDVGEASVTAVNYTNPTSTAKDVVIRTNGGTLNVGSSTDIAKGKIWHYGTLSKAIVYTENNSFHTHGLVSDMDLKAGRVVADSNGMIALLKAAAGTKAEKENGGLIFIPEGTVIGEEGINWVQFGEEGDAKQLETLGYNVVDGKAEATPEAKAVNAYKIGTKEKLIQFAKDWNSGKIVSVVPFVLTADIDISDIEWLPIGTWEYPFNGTFDGNNKTITGLKRTQIIVDEKYDVYGSSTGYGKAFGLIGISGGGDVEIKDLTLTNVNIQLANAGKNVGAVIGYSPKNGDFIEDGATWWAASETSGKKVLPSTYGTNEIKFDNVTVSGSVESSAHGAGLAGKVYSTGKITILNCTNSANISSGNNCGGLVGFISGPTEIEITGSTNDGNVHNTATSSAQVGYFAVVNTHNASDKITLKNNINNGHCENISSFNSSYNNPSFLTMTSTSSVVQNSAGKYDFSGNVDNGYLYQIDETNYKAWVIVPKDGNDSLDVEGNYAAGSIKSNGTINISKGTFGNISHERGTLNISGGTFSAINTNGTVNISGGTFTEISAAYNCNVQITGGIIGQVRMTSTGTNTPEVRILTSLAHGLTVVRGGGGNNLYTKVEDEYTIIKAADNTNTSFDPTGWTKLNGSNLTWTSFTLE